MDLEHGLGRAVESPRAPQLLVGACAPSSALELGRDAAVEDDAAFGGQQLLDLW